MKPEEKAAEMLKLLRQVDETNGCLPLTLRGEIRLLVVEFQKCHSGGLPKLVYSRDGKEMGQTTGGTRYCGVDGCKGPLIGVRWKGNKRTWPCRQGMFERADGQLQIGEPVEAHT